MFLGGGSISVLYWLVKIAHFVNIAQKLDCFVRIEQLQLTDPVVANPTFRYRDYQFPTMSAFKW